MSHRALVTSVALIVLAVAVGAMADAIKGVYAGFVEIADTEQQFCQSKNKIPAAFSIGRAKTFISDHPLLVEAHILDKDTGDLYNKYLAMDFIRFIRHQQKFESPEQLSAQIAKDCQKAKEILSNK